MAKPTKNVNIITEVGYKLLSIEANLDKDLIEKLYTVNRRGGQHTKENIVMACLSCNLKKNRRTLKEWQEMNGE